MLLLTLVPVQLRYEHQNTPVILSLLVGAPWGTEWGRPYSRGSTNTAIAPEGSGTCWKSVKFLAANQATSLKHTWCSYLYGIYAMLRAINIEAQHYVQFRVGLVNIVI